MKRISLLIFLCAVLALFAAPAWAAEVNVSTAADLKNAVNTNGNVINITADITLTSQISIAQSVIINGNSHTIDGGGTYRVFKITGGFVKINDLTIKDGNPNDDSSKHGGGMYVDSKGTATVTNCTFKDNTAQDDGGGMYVKGTVTVTNCTFTGNTAQGIGGGGNGNGGGMCVYSGIVTVTNCTFTGNKANGNGGSGGGMYVYGNDSARTATATVTNCTFVNNTAKACGGGVYVYIKGTATVTNCTFTGNTTDANGDGGGMYVYNNGTATVTNCTFTGNTTGANGNGGGMVVKGTATVINCTFVNNTAATDGAEVCVDSGSGNTLNAVNTIFWNDTASSYVSKDNSATLTLTNCAYGSGATNVAGTNCVNDLSWSGRTPNDVTVDGVKHTVFRLTASDTKLHTGGTTAAFSTTDQLGVTRSASNHSIGAVEYITFAVSTTTLPEGTVGTAYSQQLEAAFTPAQPSAELKWSVKSGNLLPDGLAIDGSTISGEPTTAGDYTFTLTAAGSGDVYSIYSADQEFTLKINSSSGNNDVSFDIGTVTITSTGGISDISLELTSRDYLHSAKTSSSDLTSVKSGTLTVLSSDQADVVVTIDPGSGDIAAVLCGSDNVPITGYEFTPSTAGTYKIIFKGIDDSDNVKYFAAGFTYSITDDTETDEDDGDGTVTSEDVDEDGDGNLVIKPGTTISSDFVNLTGDALVTYVNNFFEKSTKLSDSNRATAEDMADFLAVMGVTSADIGDEISGYKIIGAKLGKYISGKRPFIVIMRHADTGRIFLGLGVTQTRSEVFAIKFDVLQKAAATVTAEKISFPRGRYIVGATDSEEYLAKSKSEVLSTASEADTAAETEEIGSIYLGEFELAAANYDEFSGSSRGSSRRGCDAGFSGLSAVLALAALNLMKRKK